MSLVGVIARVQVSTEAPGERSTPGTIGSPAAFRAYVARAQRIAVLALLAGLASAGLALASPKWWFAAALLLSGAAFDRARGRLAAQVRLTGDELVIESGPFQGERVSRARLLAVGFGAAGRDGRAPETFWRGDFESEGFSHLITLRLSGSPRILIVPEGSVSAARAGARALRRWRSGADSAP